MRKTKVFVVWESCAVQHSVIPSPCPGLPCPCPWKGFLCLALGTALLVGCQGSCGTAVAHLCCPLHWCSFFHGCHPVLHGLGTVRLVGFFLPSTNAHRGMSLEGLFKRAADSSAPREAVPRTAAYVVGKISLFLLTPAQHPLFSKMIPPASTDWQQIHLSGELL